MSLLTSLHALPAVPAGPSIHTQTRVLAQTPEGRRVVVAYTVRVAELLTDLDPEYAAWCLARAQAGEAEGDWQRVFEGVGDLSNTLAGHLHRQLPPLGVLSSHPDYWQAREKRNAEVDELRRRLLADVQQNLN